MGFGTSEPWNNVKAYPGGTLFLYGMLTTYCWVPILSFVSKIVICFKKVHVYPVLKTRFLLRRDVIGFLLKNFNRLRYSGVAREGVGRVVTVQ